MSLALDAPEPSDGDILRHVRAGQPAAYDVLYQRHVIAARRLARSLVVPPAEADDIVAEVFAATFAAIRRGSGPYGDFRAYVLRSIRHECRRAWRRRGRQAGLAPDVAERAAAVGDDFGRHDERELLHQAFVALPARMQTVLWLVEVDGLSHAEIARRTRSTPQAIAQLAVRARRSLSERYLRAHIAATTAPSVPAQCAAARAALPELVRGTVSARRERSLHTHLAECRACADVYDELCIVNERLRGLTLLAIAAAVGVPKRWIAGVALRASGWLLGSTAPLTAAATVVVLATAVPTSVPAAPPPAVEPTVVDAAPAVAEPRPTATPNSSPAPTLARDATATAPPAASAPAAATTVTPPVGPPPSNAEPAPPTAVIRPPATAPPPVVEPAGVAVAVTVDVPSVPLPQLPELPLVGQLADELDVPAVSLEVGLGDAVDASAGIGEATINASIGGDGVAVDVAGTVDVPLLDGPPIEVPPIELTLLGD